MKTKEKHALIEAAAVFDEHGVEICMPWEGNLDERGQKLYDAFKEACRVYHDRMNHAADNS